MKRDMGLVRELLLRVEAQPAMTVPFLDYEGPFFDIEGHERYDAVRQFQVLIDAKFIDPAGDQGLDCFVVHGLTWQGQDFVDTIRNPIVWKRTMEAVKKVGSVSFDVLVGIAKLELKRVVSDKLGWSP